MKTLTKVLTITGASLLGLGIAVTAVGLTTSKAFSINEKYEKKTYDFSDSIKNLDIKESSHDIYFTKSPDSDTHVICFDSDYYKHDVEVSGDTLRIVTDLGANQAWYSYVHVGIDIDDINTIKTEIQLPEEEYDRLKIQASSSCVYTSDMCTTYSATAPSDAFTFGETIINLHSGDVCYGAYTNKSLEINTTSGEIDAWNYSDTVMANASFESSSGDIEVYNINADNVRYKASSGSIIIDGTRCATGSVSTSSGEITIKNIESSEDFMIETSSGEQNITDLKANDIRLTSSSGDIEVNKGDVTTAIAAKASSGEIILNDVTTGKLTSASFSGNCNFRNLTVSEEAEIETSSGEVEGTVIGEYFFTTDTSTGDVEIPAVSKSGVDFKIKTTSGDIEISAK